jgi:hypothetical protein
VVALRQRVEDRAHGGRGAHGTVEDPGGEGDSSKSTSVGGATVGAASAPRATASSVVPVIVSRAAMAFLSASSQVLRDRRTSRSFELAGRRQRASRDLGDPPELRQRRTSDELGLRCQQRITEQRSGTLEQVEHAQAVTGRLGRD